MNQLDLFAWKPSARAAVDALLAEPEPLATPIAPPKPAKVRLPGEGVWPPNLLEPAELLKPLRDYQQECRVKVHSHFETDDRALVVMATGAGKTVEFSALAADVVATAAGRVLVLTDQEDLVDQAIDKILDVAGLYADAEQGARTASSRAKVVVATVQSMVGRLEKYPPGYFALVVCDECDRAETPTWQRVITHLCPPGTKLLGVTATPNRTDRKSILRTFETKVFEISLTQLIRMGYLVRIEVRELPLTIDIRDAETATGDYDPEKLGHAVEKVFGEVVDLMKIHAPDRKPLVFCPDVRTSKKFAAVASLAGLTTRHIDGTSPNRKEIKKGFSEWLPVRARAGHALPHTAFQCLVNPILMGRGYDEPSIDCIVNLRPCGSLSMYGQIVGRGTRLWCPWGCSGPCEHPEAKKDLLVLDFLYQFKSLGPIRPAQLLTDSPTKIAAIQAALASGETQDLLALEEEASAAMERNLLEALLDAQKKRKGKAGEYFNALEFAANLRIPDLLDYVPENDADAEPCPERLLKRLAAQGIMPDTVVCKGQADRLLTVLQARKEAGLAGMKSVFWLRKWGYEDPENCPADRAKSILAKEFRKAGKY